MMVSEETLLTDKMQVHRMHLIEQTARGLKAVVVNRTRYASIGSAKRAQCCCMLHVSDEIRGVQNVVGTGIVGSSKLLTLLTLRLLRWHSKKSMLIDRGRALAAHFEAPALAQQKEHVCGEGR